MYASVLYHEINTQTCDINCKTRSCIKYTMVIQCGFPTKHRRCICSLFPNQIIPHYDCAQSSRTKIVLNRCIDASKFTNINIFRCQCWCHITHYNLVTHIRCLVKFQSFSLLTICVHKICPILINVPIILNFIIALL